MFPIVSVLSQPILTNCELRIAQRRRINDFIIKNTAIPASIDTQHFYTLYRVKKFVPCLTQ